MCEAHEARASSKWLCLTYVEAPCVRLSALRREAQYYSNQWLHEDPKRVPPHRDEEIMLERNKCLKRYFEDPEERNKAMIECRWTMDPYIWWAMHGTVAPRIQNLAFMVWVYKKTAEEKFPTLKKYSDKAPPTDKFATHEIKYGPQVVPISPAEWDAMKFKPEKSVKLSRIYKCLKHNAVNLASLTWYLHYYMKDVSIFIAEPGNTKAILAVSALARAMKEMQKVAILRCVWRQGQGNVVVGVLTPNVSDKDSTPDSFLFNVLPFAEDVREFQFSSFSSFPLSWQPNEQQQEAADNLVKMLDLAPTGKEEALKPEFTPNPVLERFYRHLELKSKHPDAPVPPLDETLKKITQPDPEQLSQCKSVIEEFRRHFELRENPKLKKSTKRLLGEKPSGSVKVEKVGDSTPVQDFEAMMSRRDSPEWVNKAIKDMKNKIFDLVEDSCDGDTYQKALECLVSLRKGCILEQEPKQFNDFLRHLCKFCQEKDLNTFCDFLASKGVTLVTKTEAVDSIFILPTSSEVTEDEARSFMVKREPKHEQAQ
ncbi:Ku80 family protein [Actinidia rufa]|uniref:Ku80 family protein n=1 Tax=Actinidia rufa TaxID=165716 RepID=A0A7J0F6K4_9ERIC|nr:Ku80 family protein [Actinidia rufa]